MVDNVQNNVCAPAERHSAYADGICQYTMWESVKPDTRRTLPRAEFFGFRITVVTAYLRMETRRIDRGLTSLLGGNSNMERTTGSNAPLETTFLSVGLWNVISGKLFCVFGVCLLSGCLSVLSATLRFTVSLIQY